MVLSIYIRNRMGMNKIQTRLPFSYKIHIPVARVGHSYECIMLRGDQTQVICNNTNKEHS